MKNKNGFSLLSIIIIMVVTSIASGITVGVILTNNYKDTLGISYEALQNDEKLNEFIELYASIIDEYYEDIDKDEMIDSAVNGMLDYLGETYTTYLNQAETEDLEERLSGYYKGVGITIQDKVIISIADDTPAAKSGLQVNDVIVAINNIDVSEKTNGETGLIIKKSEEDSVLITVARGEEQLTFNVEIATIPLPSIEYEMLENNVGYLLIDTFSATLESQVKNALSELEGQGMEKLIIDLRYNTGGYLDSAEQVASLFIKKGKLLYSLEGKDETTDVYDKTTDYRDYPIVIIMNDSTASAAEVLAAALKDNNGAIFVGEKSFGKGKVQQTYTLSDGSMAKYTSAKWLRPNGECIDGIGLIPDYNASMTVTYDEQGVITSTIDTQLSKAIEVISAM